MIFQIINISSWLKKKVFLVFQFLFIRQKPLRMAKDLERFHRI